MRWATGVGGAATLAVAGYFWFRARRLAHDEAVTFAKARTWYEQAQLVSDRLAALLLLAVSIALLVQAVP